MPHKGLLPADEKLKFVEMYLSGQASFPMIESEYGISNRTLRGWIMLYKTRGVEGLTPTVKNRKYPSAIKRLAVEEYLSGNGSQTDICAKYGLSDGKLLRDWIKQYNGHGDFKQAHSGGAIYMSSGRKTTLEERIEIVSYCIANNKGYSKVIERYGVSYQQIYGWVRRYEERGPDGLMDRRGKRKDEASMTEVEKLRAQLKLKEAENLRLQMENELLKKLDALERGRNID